MICYLSRWGDDAKLIVFGVSPPAENEKICQITDRDFLLLKAMLIFSREPRLKAIETNTGTYKRGLEVYLTVYLEEREHCDFYNWSLAIQN